MNNPEPDMGQAVIECIARDLNYVVGPAARLILSEKIHQLTLDSDVPARKIPELIELSSLAITDENRRAEFQRMALGHYDQLRQQASVAVPVNQEEATEGNQ